MFHLKKKKGIKKPYHWTLVSRNGQVIATSQNYIRRDSAINGMVAVLKVCRTLTKARKAGFMDHTRLNSKKAIRATF